MQSVALSYSRAEAAGVIGFSIVMGLLARVSVPLPFTPVPVTGQTLGVLTAGLVLSAPAAAAAMLLYLAQGAAGLPVFSPGGPGGLAQLIGPTGGFLLAYPLAAWLVARLSRTAGRFALAGALVSGEIVIFACGAAWLAALLRLSPVSALQGAVLPFLPGEILKVALALAGARLLMRRRPGAHVEKP